MAPTTVLSTLTSTIVKMNTTTTNTLSEYIANTSVLNSVFFFREIPGHSGRKRSNDSDDRSTEHQR